MESPANCFTSCRGHMHQLQGNKQAVPEKKRESPNFSCRADTWWLSYPVPFIPIAIAHIIYIYIYILYIYYIYHMHRLQFALCGVHLITTSMQRTGVLSFIQQLQQSMLDQALQPKWMQNAMYDVLEFKQKRKTTISLIYHKQVNVPTYIHGCLNTQFHILELIVSPYSGILLPTTLRVCAGPTTCHSDPDHSWL